MRVETHGVTEEHPFWVDRPGDGRGYYWLAAAELRPGDVLSAVERDGASVRLDEGELTVSVNVLSGETEPTYNLTVSDFHTYAVGYLNVQVHNTCLSFDTLPAGVRTTDLAGGVVRLDDGPNAGRLVRHNGNKYTEVVETINPTTGLKEFVAPVVVNQRNGAAFERALIDGANDVTGTVSKNGEVLTTTLPDGRVVNTIPDIFGSGGGLADAKDVISAAATRQLRAQIMIAQESDIPFTLVISPRTQRVSRPLREAIQALRIGGKPSGSISVFDPVTGSFTEAVFDAAGNLVTG